MFKSIKNRISFKLAQAGFIVALLLGLLLSAGQVALDYMRHGSELDSTVERILEVAKHSAGPAALKFDDKLAEEIVNGLMTYDFLIKSEISTDLGTILASEEKPHRISKTRWLTRLLTDEYRTFTIPLGVDTQKRVYGTLIAVVDNDIAFSTFYDRGVLVILFGILRNMLLVIILYGVFYLMLTKPLLNMVSAVSNISPENNKEWNSSLKDYHRNDELGLLNNKINDFLLASRTHYKMQMDTAFALQASEAHLRTLIEMIPDLIWLKDPDGVYISCNAKFERFFGAKETDIVGKTDYDFVDKELADFFRKKDKEAMAADKPCLNEEEVTYADDGHSEILETIKTPMYDFEGKLIGVLGIARDITERKRTEKALMESKTRLQISLRASNIGLWDWNLRTNDVYFSPEWKSQIGFKEDEIGNNYEVWESRLNPEDSGRVILELKAYMEGKSPDYAVEFRLRHKDGSYRWIFARGEILKDIDGNPASMMGCHVDITRRKTIEEELLKTQKLESIGVLAGGIAHDFNNLLTAIMNNLYLMKNHISPEEKVYERIIATERASARAQGLTQQLLTFSKGGAPVKGLISVRELISESISISLRGSNVRCENLIPNELWNIEADAGQMNQAINNIIINADQSMPQGGTIKIDCENVIVEPENKLTLKEGNYIKITIKDQGTGISEEHLSRIFDPYFSTKQKGSGLGLSTTYSIIMKHDGHIDIKSELGTGTMFTIYLPASMEEIQIKKPVEDEQLIGTGRVLIMDDDVFVRDSLGEMLIEIGYVVEHAVDGREAIDTYKNAMASENPFDAIIMDLTIPGGMGGTEAIRELIEIDPNVKAIVSSGYSYDPIMSNYSEYGFRAVLAKPYKDMSELNRILNDVIEGN